jgi:penicillin amidase
MKRTAILALLLAAVSLSGQDLQNGRLTRLEGMQMPGSVTREANGIPHIFAFNAHDMHFLTGWVHAQDRLFQMDANRRIASGTFAELVGTPALANDVQLRTFGLRRAAQLSLDAMSAEARAALEAYTAGVNAYLTSHPTLPPEYTLLEITQIAPWTTLDTVAIGKLLAFGLSFDLDVDPTIAYQTSLGVGRVVGFDGTKFFFGDTWRIAPFSAAATIPDATGTGAKLPLAGTQIGGQFNPTVLQLAKDYLDKVRDIEVLRGALDPEQHAGSNEWAVAPRHSTTGNALMANDPHLALGAPATFYPIAMRSGSTNVSGVGFPGAPFVIQGQNQRIAWGSTVHPMDVTDLYQEQLVPMATSPSGFASLYKGAPEVVQVIPQTFRANRAGNGVANDLVVVPASATVPQATLIVPRHGPIIQLNAQTGAALSLQYVGLYATRELEAFMRINDAGTVDEFRAALQFFDVGSQNFAYADVAGNIAYFTGGEMPLREDLQAMTVTGAPPFFIRNGQGGNEWLALTGAKPADQATPFQILPYAEMPQVVNPSNGWFVNANNDPTGHTLDNDPLNDRRPGGGIKYLNAGYDGIRGGRITQLLRARLANGGKVSPDDMKAIQADVMLYDAQVFVPYLTAALTNAKAAGANPLLAALGADPSINGAMSYLARWNFMAPTGIERGYDAADVNGSTGTPSQAEIDASVAATFYSAWRSKFLANTIDGVLRAMQMPLPPPQQALASLRSLLETYSTTGGRGVSGVNFFNVPEVEDANARRDIILLKSLADALTMLQSEEFAPAFNRSTTLSDYRWGKLHRVVFAHHMGNLFSPAAPYGPPPLPSILTLPGVAVDGGFSVVDASSHNARATTVNGFMFSSGPNRRYVGEMAPAGVRGESSLPGGVSGVVTSPWFTNLLMPWLTNDTYEMHFAGTPRIPWWRP